MIIFQSLSNIQRLKMLPEANKCPLHSTKKLINKNYHYNREDVMTKIIGTPIRNVNETLIGIFARIPLVYLFHYYHDQRILLSR